MGFEAEVEEIRLAGAAANSAAQLASHIELNAALDGIGTGLPGSQATLLIHRVAVAWRDELARWCQAMRAHAEALSAAAERYRAGDEAVAVEIQRSTRDVWQHGTRAA